MMKRGVAIGLAMTLLVFLLVPQRGLAAPTQKAKVRFGVGSAIAYNPVYVAKEKGYYEEEGLDVELLWLQAAPEVVQAIIGSSAEGGVGGSFGLIAAVSKGAPVITTAIYAYGGERIALAVRKDLGIKTLKDLYGKKVAFQSGAIGQQMFTELCAKEGLDMSQMEIVFLNNVDMAAAVASKTVDAIVTWEPQPSLLESKGLVAILQRGGKYLKSPGCVIFGTGFIKSNRDAVLRFTKAHFRASQFIRQNPKEAAVINSKYIRGAVPEVLQKSYDYLIFDPRVNKDMLGELEADMNFMLSQKKIASPVKPNLLATTEFSDEIVKKYPELVKDLK
jgi:ABC-type nitrate/sulfonate/bicarbonate transport system substrate-binding protein